MSDRVICGIYYIKNMINDKYYVGQSINVEERWRQERMRLSSKKTAWNVHLQNAWRLYGENNFEFVVIEECLPNELDERETYWIQFYNSFYSGYNKTPGGAVGVRGIPLTEEHRKKISESIKQSLTEEDRQRLRNLAIERWNIPENHIKCSQKSLEWWSDPQNKEKMTGVNNKNYGKKRDDWAEKYSGINSFNHKACVQIETGKFYCTMTEASRETGIQRPHICSVCRGNRKTAGGYHWRYATEEEILSYLSTMEVAV